jgi:hypothetical protein
MELSDVTKMNGRKLFLVIHAGTDQVHKTGKRKAQGSLVRWDELNIRL